MLLLEMRTTLNLDDDVVETAKTLAASKGQPLGVVISDLIRRAVEPPTTKSYSQRNGIPLFPVSRRARPVTPEIIAKLLDEEP